MSKAGKIWLQILINCRTLGKLLKPYASGFDQKKQKLLKVFQIERDVIRRLKSYKTIRMNSETRVRETIGSVQKFRKTRNHRKLLIHRLT